MSRKRSKNGLTPTTSAIPIEEHEGNKYLREIVSPVTGEAILVDIYAVLEAFKVVCQARGHAIKKLLCAGERGKGDTLADLIGVQAAVSRAIQLEEQRCRKRSRS